MKLSDLLEDVGRPVAYYPSMARMLGDMKEAVFLCQMAYWKGKEVYEDGWIYKSAEQIEEETALSYREQTGVRDGLKSKGLLEDWYSRTEHRTYFRVNWDAVNNLWDEFVKKEHLTKCKMPPKHFTKGEMPPDKMSDGIRQKRVSLNSITEITANNTQENAVSSEANQLWGRITDQLKPSLKNGALSRLESARAMSLTDELLTIAVSDEDTRAWLESRMTAAIDKLMPGFGLEATVQFVTLEQP